MKSVLTKLRMAVTNNITLKIVALLLAALVWLAVVNLSDPNKTITISNIPITIVNEEAITEQNKVYSIDDKMMVNVVVTGKRSIIQELSSDDFEAYISLDELSVVNSVPVVVTAKSKRVESKISMSNQSVASITLSIEDLKEETYEIKVVTEGDPATGYYVGDVSYPNSTVKVVAPESVQNQIDSAIVTVDVSGLKDDTGGKYSVKLYKKNGKAVKNDNITKSIKKMNVRINMIKGKEVPITVITSGLPLKGYELLGVEYSPQSVTILGREDVVSAVTQITVPGEVINVANASNDIVYTVDLKEYLPENVKLLDEENSEIEIIARISKYSEKEIEIKTSDISKSGLSDKYAAEFADSTIKVTVTASSDVLKDISAKDLKASVNLKGVKEGSNSVEVSIKTPKKVEVAKKIKTKIKIKKK